MDTDRIKDKFFYRELIILSAMVVTLFIPMTYVYVYSVDIFSNTSTVEETQGYNSFAVMTLAREAGEEFRGAPTTVAPIFAYIAVILFIAFVVAGIMRNNTTRYLASGTAGSGLVCALLTWSYTTNLDSFFSRKVDYIVANMQAGFSPFGWFTVILAAGGFVISLMPVKNEINKPNNVIPAFSASEREKEKPYVERSLEETVRMFDETENFDDDATGIMQSGKRIELTDMNDPSRKYSFSTERNVLIGRARKDGNHTADICIVGSKMVSHEHCDMYSYDDRVCIKDHNSKNGTYIKEGENFKRLAPGEERKVISGDIIKLGDVKLMVVISDLI